MKQLQLWQIELLKKPLPSEAIAQHPTKTFLSTIKAIYVIERLNDVFGIGKWRLKSSLIENENKMVIVQAKLEIPEYDIELESYGGNDNTDKGDAYKGATTDALTKICSMLGIGIDVFKGLHGKTVHNNKADSTQITKIEQLLMTAYIDEEEKMQIDAKMNKFSFERANDCINYLLSKQVDPIESGNNYTQTDIKNKLKQL